MELTDDRYGLKLQKSKRFCAIKGDNVISSIGAPNTPLWIVHSEVVSIQYWRQTSIKLFNQTDFVFTLSFNV